MARVTRYIDDVTGKEIAEGDGGPVVFSLQGEFYQVDISSDTLARLEKALKPYVDVATPVEAARPEPARRRGRAAARSTAISPTENKKQVSSIRAWARENGYEISDRGRVPAGIVAAYDAAN